MNRRSRSNTTSNRRPIANSTTRRPLAYSVKGRWTALGTIGHWGHVHTRQNLYDAIVTVEAVEGSWKITDLELLEERRIDPNAPATATVQAAGG